MQAVHSDVATVSSPDAPPATDARTAPLVYSIASASYPWTTRWRIAVLTFAVFAALC